MLSLGCFEFSVGIGAFVLRMSQNLFLFVVCRAKQWKSLSVFILNALG